MRVRDATTGGAGGIRARRRGRGRRPERPRLGRRPVGGHLPATGAAIRSRSPLRADGRACGSSTWARASGRSGRLR